MVRNRISSFLLMALLSASATGVFAQISPTPTGTPTLTPTATLTPTGTPSAVPLSPAASAGLVFMLAGVGLWFLLRRKPSE